MKDTAFIRRQSGVIPYRRIGGNIEILMITTRSNKWTTPKGGIKIGLTAAQSAMEEAFEEAGIIGRLLEPSIGCFEYSKRGRRYRVEVFLCEVLELKEVWQEADVRMRQWIAPQEAAYLAKFEGLRCLYESIDAAIEERLLQNDSG